MLIEAKKGMVERQRSDVSRRRCAVQAAFEAEISENRSARGDELLNKESGKSRSDGGNCSHSGDAAMDETDGPGARISQREPRRDDAHIFSRPF